jgi:hypothetical protein
MTPIRRDVACAVRGLFACAHLGALGAVEAAHPHHFEGRPTVIAEALPVEPEHTHQDFDRSVRLGLNSVTVSGTSTDAPPFVRRSVLSEDVVMRAWENQRRHRPAYYERRPSVAPLLLATGSSTSTSTSA